MSYTAPESDYCLAALPIFCFYQVFVVMSPFREQVDICACQRLSLPRVKESRHFSPSADDLLTSTAEAPSTVKGTVTAAVIHLRDYC